MATNNVVLPGTGETVSTDVLTTLNGAGIATGEEAQRMKVAWGPAGTGTDVDTTTPFPTSINASIFRFSTNNTSVVQLASNATFPGVIETALDQPSISLLMTSDQPMTLTVKQYIDLAGTRAVPDIVYYIPANQGLSASFALNGNYVNVTAKNTGASTTTTFSLNTAYGSLPSSDGTGRLPVSKADCVQLLLTTISAAGTSSAIDTNGFGAVVAQLSGVWQGYAYFESSNDGLAWDTVLVFSRDNLSLQDVITSGGLYTIRPSGRYLHLVVTNITGTMNINAQGRAAEGIAAGDLLSLAMDRNNNAPLNVALMGTKQDAQGALMLADGYGPLYGSGNAAGQIGPIIDTLGYPLLSMTISGGVFTGVIESSNDASPGSWNVASGVASSQSWGGTGLFTILQSMTVTATLSSNLSIATAQGRYFRLRASVYTSGNPSYVAYLRNGSSPIGYTLNQAVSGSLTSAGTTTNTPATPTASLLSSAATTNGTVVKASAGTIYGFAVSNTGAAAAFFKLHNSTTITVGTTAVALTVSIPASGTIYVDYGALGMRYGTGICYSITNLAADTDTTAVALNQVKVNLSYI